MSYEGFEQCICSEGHYFENYDMYDHTPRCQECFQGQGKIVFAAWSNSVDQTNGGAQGLIPTEKLDELFLKEPTKTETCPTCNHCKLVSSPIYRIPTIEETDPLRQFDEGI